MIRQTRKNVIAAVFLMAASVAFAQEKAAVRTPPEVENQAQSIEARFNSVLNEECTGKICTPVGCEVSAFRTLDQTQNSSLPGLDVSDEVSGPLQYKLSAMNCAFTYEPSLSDEAVTSLRKRISDKVRTAGVNVVIAGRKLSAANPLLHETSKPPAPAEEPPASRALLTAAPYLLYMLAFTLAALALIWAFRRLGKEPVIVTLPEEKNPGALAVSDTEGPRAEAIEAKAAALTQTFTAHPEIAAAALAPLVKENKSEELCRVLKHFGPAPLAPFAQETEYRDLFAEVHQRYAADGVSEDPQSLLLFFEKLERLVTLAELGRPNGNVREELAFLRDLEPDEFAPLVTDLKDEELMAVLSFVPAELRAHFLQACEPAFVDDYVKNVLNFPRLSEQVLRQLAGKLREQYTRRRSEIKKVSRNQLTQIEQLLNTLGAPQRRELYVSLRKKDPALFERLMSDVLLDRALVHAPAEVLNDVFLTLTPDEAAAYLKNHPDRQALLGKLKVPLAQSIRTRMDLTTPSFGLNLDFVETAHPLSQRARGRVAEILKAKSAKGEVNLRGINESVLGTL